jgi:hypothetical protein
MISLASLQFLLGFYAMTMKSKACIYTLLDSRSVTSTSKYPTSHAPIKSISDNNIVKNSYFDYPTLMMLVVISISQGRLLFLFPIYYPQLGISLPLFELVED